MNWGREQRATIRGNAEGSHIPPDRSMSIGSEPAAAALPAVCSEAIVFGTGPEESNAPVGVRNRSRKPPRRG